MDRLGQYRIIRQLGAGAMGVVWLAEHELLQVHRAVKVMPERLAGSEGFRERFLQEARVLARLQHPHIVPVHDMVVEGDSYAIAMDFVSPDGSRSQSLLDLVGDGTQADAPTRLQSDDVARIMGETCSAIAFAHEKGVIHRDIKAANVLVGPGGSVRVSDFGLASIVGDQYLRDSMAASLASDSGGAAASLGAAASIMAFDAAPGGAGESMGAAESMASSTAPSGAASIVGTFQYMPPEVQQGGPWSARGDVYSLGVLAYFLLTGRIPAGRWRRPSALFPDISAGWDAFVEAALASEPGERHESVNEMLAEVAHLGPQASGAGRSMPALSGGRREALARAETEKLRRESLGHLHDRLMRHLGDHDEHALTLAVRTAIDVEPEALAEVALRIVDNTFEKGEHAVGCRLVATILRYASEDNAHNSKLGRELKARIQSQFEAMAAVFSNALARGDFARAESTLAGMVTLGTQQDRVERLSALLDEHKRRTKAALVLEELNPLLDSETPDLELARSLADRLTELLPDDATAMHAVERVVLLVTLKQSEPDRQRARAAERAGQWESAHTAWKAVLAALPDDIEARTGCAGSARNCAMGYLQQAAERISQNKIDQASALGKRAARLCPDDHRIADAVARVEAVCEGVRSALERAHGGGNRNADIVEACDAVLLLSPEGHHEATQLRIEALLRIEKANQALRSAVANATKGDLQKAVADWQMASLLDADAAEKATSEHERVCEEIRLADAPLMELGSALEKRQYSSSIRLLYRARRERLDTFRLGKVYGKSLGHLLTCAVLWVPLYLMPIILMAIIESAVADPDRPPIHLLAASCSACALLIIRLFQFSNVSVSTALGCTLIVSVMLSLGFLASNIVVSFTTKPSELDGPNYSLLIGYGILQGIWILMLRPPK